MGQSARDEAPAGARERSSGDTVTITDLSHRPRVGWKGPRAEEWWQQLGLGSGAAPNCWTPLPGGGILARLGRGEYLVEDGEGGEIARSLSAALAELVPGVYPVPRGDTALQLSGEGVGEFLAQTCALDVRPGRYPPETLLLTMLAGVSVLLIPDLTPLGAPESSVRVWCDGTYGEYLRGTLEQIAGELE